MFSIILKFRSKLLNSYLVSIDVNNEQIGDDSSSQFDELTKTYDDFKSNALFLHKSLLFILFDVCYQIKLVYLSFMFFSPTKIGHRRTGGSFEQFGANSQLQWLLRSWKLKFSLFRFRILFFFLGSGYIYIRNNNKNR